MQWVSTYNLNLRPRPRSNQLRNIAGAKTSEDDTFKMLEFLVDSIFVVFYGKVFQQIVGIPMGTNFSPLLADIILYSYEVFALIRKETVGISVQLGIEFYLFVSHEGMKRQRFHV